MLKSGSTFNCSVKDRIKSFYRSLNGILRVEGQSDDLILLRLIEAHCLPILTYGIEIIHVAHRDERRSLRVAYNAIYRRIFRYRMFESVSNLQHLLGRTPGRSWSICGAKISCIERDCVQQVHSSGHFSDGLQLLCCFFFLFSLSFKLYPFHAAVYYTYSVNKCHISPTAQ